MRMSILRMWVMLRRFRRGPLRQGQIATQLESLVRRADPGASWQARTAWIADLAAWLRQDAPEGELRRQRAHSHHRATFLLNWLDLHADARERVQGVLRTTLREALGPELFCATGLQREPAFLAELSEHLLGRLLPAPPAPADLSALFGALFPEPGDADWLLGLDGRTVTRLWRLMADEGDTAAWRAQVDEGLRHLAMMVLSTGIGPAFRQRLPRTVLRDSPFMALRDAIDALLAAPAQDRAALGSVRRAVDACRGQIERIYAHLDRFGVSVGLVYHVEGMRAQLARIGRLAELRAAAVPGQAQTLVQGLLAELVLAQHERASVRGLMRRNLSLLARKMVERNADHGEHYIARDPAEYRAMLRAAAIGGIVTAFVLLGKNLIGGLGLPRFFEGLFTSIDYAAGFLLIAALGGVLATKQPAVTAPALAAKMVALDTVDGLRALMQEIACLLRSQAAAVFGNLAAVVPAMLGLALLAWLSYDMRLMTPAKAEATIASLSVWGITPLYAALTGVLLWLASLAAGFADNWFALRRLRDALTHHRRLVGALGARRARRLAAWVEMHLATVVGNVTLAFLLGMTPVVSAFFGLPLDTRHVTLATASFTAAASTLGWDIFATPAPWLAMGGILLTGLFNVGVAFACALGLALQARAVPRRVRRVVFRQVLRRLSTRPGSYLFSRRGSAAERAPGDNAAGHDASRQRDD